MPSRYSNTPAASEEFAGHRSIFVKNQRSVPFDTLFKFGYTRLVFRYGTTKWSPILNKSPSLLYHVCRPCFWRATLSANRLIFSHRCFHARDACMGQERWGEPYGNRPVMLWLVRFVQTGVCRLSTAVFGAETGSIKQCRYVLHDRSAVLACPGPFERIIQHA